MRFPRLSQGDLITDVDFIETAVIAHPEVTISVVCYPLVIVLTQDCDLHQDSTLRARAETNHDKYLISVLVAPVYNAEQFRLGEHLSELGHRMQQFSRNKTPWQRILSNTDPRYHYLSFPEDLKLPDGVIDFKHYFSVSRDHLSKLRVAQYVATVSHLYREDISHRFASFLSRIGLPQ